MTAAVVVPFAHQAWKKGPALKFCVEGSVRHPSENIQEVWDV